MVKKRKLNSTFAIKESKKGFTLIQTRRGVFVGSVPKKVNLGTFKTKSQAKREQKLARQLVGNR